MTIKAINVRNQFKGVIKEITGKAKWSRNVNGIGHRHLGDSRSVRDPIEVGVK